MLDLLHGTTRTCQGVNRRTFLKIGSLAGLGVSLPLALRQKQALAREGRVAQDVNCIFIWTHGGTSHHDTLDPKPDAPVNVRGEFGAIGTAVPGVQFSEIVPRLAKELKRFA